MIHYYEDGRNELYNLTDDLSEQTDVAMQHPERVAEMKKRLDAWLTETGAKIPQPDPRFNQTKFDARMKKVRDVQMPKLEKQHADYLDKSKNPSPDWWGSAKD